MASISRGPTQSNESTIPVVKPRNNADREVRSSSTLAHQILGPTALWLPMISQLFSFPFFLPFSELSSVVPPLFLLSRFAIISYAVAVQLCCFLRFGVVRRANAIGDCGLHGSCREIASNASSCYCPLFGLKVRSISSLVHLARA